MAGESIFERVAECVKLSLLAVPITGIADRVFRAREDAVTAEEGDTLNVVTEDNSQRSFSDEVDDNELTIAVSIYVRGDVWETKADVYARQVHALVMGYGYAGAGLKLAPPRLTDQDWTGEGGDRTPGKRTMKFAFRFLTLRTDISAQP